MIVVLLLLFTPRFQSWLNGRHLSFNRFIKQTTHSLKPLSFGLPFINFLHLLWTIIPFMFNCEGILMSLSNAFCTCYLLLAHRALCNLFTVFAHHLPAKLLAIFGNCDQYLSLVVIQSSLPTKYMRKRVK